MEFTAVTVQVDPRTDELNELSEAHAALAELGIAPGRGGYDIATLAAAVYDHSWSYGIDLETGTYVAEIKTENPDRTRSGSHQQATRVRQGQVTAYGNTPDEALAVALARALGWVDRGASG